MVFHTISGSVYEVDLTKKCVRRLAGKEDPTPRQGDDGKYKQYEELLPPIPEAGKSLFIFWPEDKSGMPPCTITSRIERIVEESNLS